MTRSTPARLYQERSKNTISPRVGRLLHVALEVPLPAFDVAGLVEGHDPRRLWVEVLHEALDRPTLAGGVPAFEQDDDLDPRGFDPALHLEQFDLEQGLLPFVGPPLHLPCVGVDALLEDAGDGVPVVTVRVSRAASSLNGPPGAEVSCRDGNVTRERRLSDCGRGVAPAATGACGYSSLLGRMKCFSSPPSSTSVQLSEARSMTATAPVGNLPRRRSISCGSPVRDR